MQSLFCSFTVCYFLTVCNIQISNIFILNIKQDLFSFFAGLQTFWYTIFRYKRLGFPARQVLEQLHSNFQIHEHNKRSVG